MVAGVSLFELSTLLFVNDCWKMNAENILKQAHICLTCDGITGSYPPPRGLPLVKEDQSTCVEGYTHKQAT